MIRRTVSLLTMLVVLAACGGAPAAQSPTAAPAPTAAPQATAAPAAPAGFPLTIENCGRSLTFEKPPERAVSLWQPQNEILLALGVQDHVVAMAGNYDELPADLAPRAAGIKVVGTSMAWPSKEVLLNEKPDLVVSEGLSGFAFDAAQGYATVEEIEATGAHVVSAGGNCNPSDPASSTKSFETVYSDIAMFGAIFGVADRATALITEMKAKEAAVLDKIKGRDPVKVAFYNGGEGPLGVLTSGIWEEAMTKAGGTDVLPANVYQVSVEEFASAEPDVILVGTYPGQEAETSIAFLKKTFPNVPAVKNNRLVPIATIDTEAGVRVVNGLEQIAKGLHPEAFGEAPAAYPVAIESCGRALTFDKAPERVVTTYPNAAELLIRLGVGDTIVGSMYHKDTPVTAEVAEAFNQIPAQFDGYPSKEELVSLNANLALSVYDAFDFNGQSLPAFDEAAGFGLSVYSMSTECGGGTNTRATLDMIYDDVLNLGKIFGAQARAQQMVAEMQGQVAAVQQKVSGQAPLKATIYYGGEGPLGVFTNGIYADLLKLAGGQTVFPDEPQNSAEVSVEVFADRNPDVIFVIEYGTPFAQMRDYLRKTFPNISAVKNDRIVLVDGGVFPPGYRNVEAVELFARAMHPEAFGEAAPAAARTQYPLTITDCGGHSATFAQAPQTPVTMDPQAFELMFWLGLGEQQIAAGPQPLPAVPDQFKAAAQQVTSIASGDTDYPSKEALLAAKPDFVYGSYTSGFNGDLVFSEEEWAARGVNTYWSFGIGGCVNDDPQAPRASLDPVFKDIENLGKIFDVQDRANALIAQMRADLAAALAAVDATQQLRVATFGIAEYSDGKPGIYGSRSTVNAIITMAGGTNVFADVGEAYTETNWEEYITRDPQVILLIAYPAAIPQAWDDAEKLLTELPALQNVAAVKNRSFVRVTFPEVGAGGVRNVDAVKKLAEALAKLK